MKTAAEWMKTRGMGAKEWASAIQADARAGMVPEGELADLRCKVEVLENSIRSYELSTGEHEAELAEMKAIMASSTDVAWLESLSNRVKQAMDMAAEMERELESWRHGVPMSGHYTCSDTLALARVTDECDALRAQNSLLRGEADDAREQFHRALAKAWEAAASAQWQHDIDSHQKLCQCRCPDPSLVQPPGGKAK